MCKFSRSKLCPLLTSYKNIIHSSSKHSNSETCWEMRDLFYLFSLIFGCAGSSGSWLLHMGFLQYGDQALLSGCGVWASLVEHGLEGTQAAVVVYARLVAPRCVASSLARGRTGVPFITRQVFNHWTTREARHLLFNLGKMVKDCLCFAYVALIGLGAA